MIQPKLGQMIVDDDGINKVIKIDDWGGYTSELIIPKETFIEAYKKWIIKEAGQMIPKGERKTIHEITNSEIAKRLNGFNELLLDRFVNGLTWEEIWDKYQIYEKTTQILVKHIEYKMKDLLCGVTDF